ncbi:MAG: M20 family metallo-hydrolase [candidate division WOR-3 bacterium]
MWEKSAFEKICQEIDRLVPAMIEMQSRLCALPAISPKSGGEGEKARADYLRGVVESWGLAVEELRAPDPLAPCGYRPNLIVRLPREKSGPVLWVMTHLDVVPPGPRELWQSDPFVARVEADRIYGRGVEDNQQEMVASIFALRALLNLGLVPSLPVALMLVADEETGSEFGVDWLLKNYQLCAADDLVVVPDAGNEDGTLLEVAEKSILWLKFTTYGRQAHGSTPHHGNNAHRAGAYLLVRLDQKLHEHFNARDELFSPPYSTIEPTKKETNVPNINTIPGEDVFYFDMRILPCYPLESVMAKVKEVVSGIEQEFKVRIRVDVEQQAQAAPATPPDAPVVRLLAEAVRTVYKKEPFTRGIGGGTVAAFFRRQGIPAVVWGRNAGQAHKPNEFCLIENMAGNAKVYAYLYGSQI